MNIIEISGIIIILIAYNIFVHHMITYICKSYTYEDKIDYGIAYIFISGIVGIVLSKILLKHNEIYSESIVSMGLLIGSLILILTSVYVNWNNITDDIKIFLTTSMFFGCMIYFYNLKKTVDVQ